MKVLVAILCLSVCACPSPGGSQTPQPNPLNRQYREGEKLVYHMKGVNEAWHYEIDADAVVKKDAAGRFFEEFEWTHMETAGQPQQLATSAGDFRQRITLDPNENPSMPDLSKVDPKLIGPITDMMTFYVDLWLANKLGALKKAGDHFYFRNPMPASSWADGTRVLVGVSAIDFDMTLKAVDSAAGTALLEVKHVPPEKSALPVKAAWMQVPVESAPNNWMTVSKTPEGKFDAGVGQETFTDEITISLADGHIVSATMDNPVKTIERVCEDEALTKCGDAKPHLIVRKIEIAMQRGDPH
jgi:hypothetical protein